MICCARLVSSFDGTWSPKQPVATSRTHSRKLATERTPGERQQREIRLIDRAQLLSDLQKLLRKLEADLLEHSEADDIPEMGQVLRAEYQKAKKTERTAQSYEEQSMRRLISRSASQLDQLATVPLLACLIELLPWLKQWHNAVDPEFGLPMGDYFEGFIQEEARQMGKTVTEIKAWKLLICQRMKRSCCLLSSFMK